MNKAAQTRHRDQVETAVKNFGDSGNPEDLELLSRAQLARLFGVSVRTINRKIAEGKLPPPITGEDGTFTRWSRSQIRRYLYEQNQ